VLKEKRNGGKVNTAEKNSPNFIWTETQLSKFGFKCIINKYDSCTRGGCECLCHPHNQKWWNVSENEDATIECKTCGKVISVSKLEQHVMKEHFW